MRSGLGRVAGVGRLVRVRYLEMKEPHKIHLRGAREHNLTGVDLALEHGRWTAVVGPSGSGKTSLVFDTLVREGERRFLGSLSQRARQFFGKLGRSDVDGLSGLPVAIAVGEKAVSPSPRSTVGTLTGCLDLLRLVFARGAVDPEGVALTRSHFSFNHPIGQCEACSGLGVEDRVDEAKIVADPSKSLREGALVPTLKNGYTVYSQVTLEVMNTICKAHGFDVDIAWQELTDEQRRVIMHGSNELKVPFGKHPIESRMKWEGITARPREEGYYRGLVPVIEETLKRNRNENILRFVSSAACSICAGTRLSRPGREALLDGFTLPELLALRASEFEDATQNALESEVWLSVRSSFMARIGRLVRLGLGHLRLDRTSTSLSGGEAQRVRLAAQLGAGLSGLLYALDEPTLGLHPVSQAGMGEVLDELVEQGNTLVVVEHDPDMVRHADQVIALGPGAGSLGGEIISRDEPRLADPLGRTPEAKAERRAGSGSLWIHGASLNNLKSASLEVTLGALNVVCGPSGAGKSSLVFGTLLPALLGERGGPYTALEGWRAGAKNNTQAVDARPIGKTPRSTPATWCGLFDLVRKLFAATEQAQERGFGAGHFSFNSKLGRCEACEGLGVTRIGLHLFDDVELLCASCAGARYSPAILEVELGGKNIAEVLAMTFREAHGFFTEHEAVASMCAAMIELGLDYLALGQSSGSLSRGEAQRIKLGTLLGSKRKRGALVLLDEPDRGLAPSDVEALLKALDALVDAGHTVLAISHHRQVWAAADRLTEVRDGRTNATPQIDWSPLSERRAPRPARQPAANIELRGVSTHNLRGIDVDLPRGALIAICGLSGSGKSSLAFDTLAGESWRRFAESLPFQVRRYMRRLPRPELSSARGLTPVLSLRQEAPRTGARSTVATQTELGPLLRLIFARAGKLNGEPCRLSASHFSRDRTLGACPECRGRGVLQRCDVQLLVTQPSRPLLAAKGAGAMSGTRPGDFFTERDGQYMATLMAALPDEQSARLLAETPWQELTGELRELILNGTGDVLHRVRWEFASEGEGDGAHEFEATWVGLSKLVEREAEIRVRAKKAAEWTAVLGDAPCPTCAGSGLNEAARQTRVLGETLGALGGMPLGKVMGRLETARATQDNSQADLAVFDALFPELRERLGELVALGLGHLSLERTSMTLSSGELQRVRLASVLRSGLSGITLVLDEPAAGLHGREVRQLLARLREFQAEGNTVVLVSHRPAVLEAVDHWIELGPGAGDDGGALLAAGPREVVMAGETPTARAVSRALELRASSSTHSAAELPSNQRILVRAAGANNLDDLDIELPQGGALDVELPLKGFVCLTGVSGSGKSSLAFDVIGASFKAGAAVECEAIELPGGFAHFQAVHDSRELGRGATALTALDIAGELAALFHAENKALPRRAFKLGDAKGRCPTCRGAGRERVAMDFMADLELACPSCAGQRFSPEVLAATWRGRNIAELLSGPAAALLHELRASSPASTKLISALEALEQVAALHIPLGRPRTDLSGGESARLGLAAGLLHSASPALYLFDEPARGLHELDLARVTATFKALGERGDLIIATEHRSSMIAAADWVVELDRLQE